MELLFSVLARLDLKRDAASIYRSDLPARPWAEDLLEAYLDAPGRLVVHGLPLYSQNLAQLYAYLTTQLPRSLTDDCGRRLCRLLLSACREEEEDLRLRWKREDVDGRAVVASEVEQFVREELTPLRRALWQGEEGGLLPLRILDCPVLGNSAFTHGRAATAGDCRIVAVSLAVDRGQLLCQILHEEIHARSDPQIMKESENGNRSTQLGSDGFALHRRLEAHAVEMGQLLLANHGTHWLDAYGAWRKRYGV
jgi:hypothetical protein